MISKLNNLCQTYITKETVTRYIGYTASKMHSLTHFVYSRAKGFSIFDFAILKLCLISFGLWIGSKFSKFFKKFKFILLIGFIISSIYLIWRIFFADNNN